MANHTKSPAIRRYVRRFMLSMTAYAADLVLVIWIFTHYHPTGPLAYLLALLPAVPVVGLIVVVGMYLAEEKDEFQRHLLTQTMLWALGATLATTTAWGFLEDFVNIVHLQPYLVFPLFWFYVGVASPFIRMRYK